MFHWVITVVFVWSFGIISPEGCSQSNEVDIVYLLDASGSVGVAKFNIHLKYIANMVDGFNIGLSATRVSVGIMQYNGSVDFKIDLASNSSRNALKTAIRSIQYPNDGWEDIDDALAEAKLVLERSDRWQSATSIVFILTDGGTIGSTDSADNLKNRGVSIYAAGIGLFPSRIHTITSSSSYVVTLTDSTIDDLQGPILDAVCYDSNYPCSSSPCINGSCINTWASFRCECVPGFNGTFCQHDINECLSTPCHNNGTCIDEINTYSCNCAPGFTGPTCLIDIDECASSPCEKGGTCHDRVNAFTCDCPIGRYGDFCETDICQPSVADIVFVLDSSVSQTEAQFNKQLEFVNQFIDQIVIGEENLQVGVVTYSFEAKIEIHLAQYNDNVTLKEAVSNIKYRPGVTFTDKGLEAATEIFKNAPKKRPYGKTAKRYVYVLTDGMSNDRRKTEQNAYELKSNVNKVLAIGIGKEVSHKELLAIASKDSSYDRKFVYSVQNFDALYTILKELVKLSCDECTWKTSSDIVFVLDASPSISLNDFQSALNAITYLTDETAQMENENSSVRLGMVSYDGNKIKLHRSLNDSTPKDRFLAEIQGIVLEGAHCSVLESECDVGGLDDAVAYVRGNVFEPKTFAMNNDTREKIIVLANGQNMDNITEKLNTELDNLKAENRTMYIVALGELADIPTLQTVVGDPALVFSLYDETQLSILDALTTNFFSSSCELSNDFVNDP